jgi:hypothetical protein
MTPPRTTHRHEARDDEYDPDAPRKGPVGAHTAKEDLADSFNPERLPEPPKPQTQAGKRRVSDIEQNTLSPSEAEEVIVRVRGEQGLDETYARKVRLGDDGLWVVVGPEGDETYVEPMSEANLRKWLKTVHFAQPITDHDAITGG